MNQDQKRGIVKFFGTAGVVVFLASIFLNRIPFEVGIVIAVAFWMLGGIIEKFLGIDSEGNPVSTVSLSAGIVSVVGALGVVVILMGIFWTNVDFMLALFIAIVLWMSSGVIATFLGVEKQPHKRRKRYAATGYHTMSPLQADPVVQYSESSPSNPSFATKMDDQGPSKKFCLGCGTSLALDAQFCFNCGEVQA